MRWKSRTLYGKKSVQGWQS